MAVTIAPAVGHEPTATERVARNEGFIEANLARIKAIDAECDQLRAQGKDAKRLLKQRAELVAENEELARINAVLERDLVPAETLVQLQRDLDSAMGAATEAANADELAKRRSRELLAALNEAEENQRLTAAMLDRAWTRVLATRRAIADHFQKHPALAQAAVGELV